jgi:hypothetical protein
MSPIVADGAYVAFADGEESPAALDGHLVVAWVDGRPTVRWYGRSGRFGVLRAENTAQDPATILLDPDDAPEQRRVRRVLWISTPH